MLKLPLLITRVDFLNKKLKILSNKPKDSKIKMKKSEREFKLKTLLKVIVLALNIH